MASVLKEDYMQNQVPTKADRNLPSLVQSLLRVKRASTCS